MVVGAPEMEDATTGGEGVVLVPARVWSAART
jgi:hypothetical protein